MKQVKEKEHNTLFGLRKFIYTMLVGIGILVIYLLLKLKSKPINVYDIVLLLGVLLTYPASNFINNTLAIMLKNKLGKMK